MSIVVYSLALIGIIWVGYNFFKFSTSNRPSTRLSADAIGTTIDNNGYLYVDAINNENKIMCGKLFCQLKQDYRNNYGKSKTANKKAKLALIFIEKIAQKAHFKSQYNVVITAENDSAPSLYLYVQTDQMNCMWSVKLIPNEDLDTVGILLHRLVDEKYTERQTNR